MDWQLVLTIAFALALYEAGKGTVGLILLWTGDKITEYGKERARNQALIKEGQKP